MKVTICAYDSAGNMDGPSAWLKRLLPWLTKKSVEVRVLFFADRSKNLPVVSFLQKKGIACRIIYWDLFHEEKIRELLKDLQIFRPDIFIANYFPVACAASTWIKNAGIPTVIVMHNDNEFHYALVREYASNSKSPIKNIVSVSKNITTNIKEFISKEITLSTIPYGAPLPNKTVILPPEKKLKVIYAGRLNENQKRISELTKAFCRAAQEVPGTEYIIYGSGAALNNVLTILKNKGKNLPVQYGGLLDSNTILENFLQHHVFVLLSNYEGIPISLMEAMGCGLVPICTHVKSGVTEIVKHGETGLLVEANEDSFVQAIRIIKNDAAMHTSISANARELIETEYSEEICNGKWLSLLQKIANEPQEKNEFSIPSLKELKSYRFLGEHKGHTNPMPHSLIVPFVRLKHLLARVKRLIINQ